MKRTLLLVALFSIYAAFVFGGVLRGILKRGAFDPLLPLARTVELRIGEKRFAEALPVALELQQAYPAESMVSYWLAQIHHGLEHPAPEAEAWERYMAVSPAPAEACPALPLAYARLRRMEQSLASYERCTQLAPADANLHRDLGRAYASAGKQDEARAAFARAASLDAEPQGAAEGAR